MKKTLLITVVVAILIGSLTFSAFAYGGQNPGAKGLGPGFGLKALNLTADQQQKILTIRQEFERDTLSLRQEMQKKRQELKQLWSADNLNQAAIDAKTKEMTALRIKMVQKSREMFTKIKGILTPEQLKQLETQKQKRFQMRRGRGMKGGFGCQGLGI